MQRLRLRRAIREGTPAWADSRPPNHPPPGLQCYICHLTIHRARVCGLHNGLCVRVCCVSVCVCGSVFLVLV